MPPPQRNYPRLRKPAHPIGCCLFVLLVLALSTDTNTAAFSSGERPAGNRAIGGDPIDLSTGLYGREDDDLLVDDTPPIRFTRTYRNRDSRSRAFGIGTNHPYDIFLVGDNTAFTWADLIMADGGRIHYVRISPGSSHVDAVYTYDDAHQMLTIKEPGIFITNDYDSGGRVIGQRLSDGRTYKFAYILRQGRIVQTDVTEPDGSMRRVIFNADGYSVSDTYTPRTDQRSITYSREAGSNKVLTVTVACSPERGPVKNTAPVGPGETVEQVESRLLQKCE